MKKALLIVVLILNLVCLVVTGSAVFKYLLSSKKTPGKLIATEDKSQTEEKVLSIDEQQIPETDIEIVKEELTGPAKLDIASVPSGAKIFINGYYKGKTPVEIEVVSVNREGGHVLTLVKEGYLKWNRRIELKNGEVKKFNTILVKEETR